MKLPCAAAQITPKESIVTAESAEGEAAKRRLQEQASKDRAQVCSCRCCTCSMAIMHVYWHGHGTMVRLCDARQNRLQRGLPRTVRRCAVVVVAPAAWPWCTCIGRRATVASLQQGVTHCNRGWHARTVHRRTVTAALPCRASDAIALLCWRARCPSTNKASNEGSFELPDIVDHHHVIHCGSRQAQKFEDDGIIALGLAPELGVGLLGLRLEIGLRLAQL
eukprot:508110-Pelagomonas_calceolata.AAC.3